MNLKIYHRSGVIWNIVLFNILCLVFLYFTYAVNQSQSPLDFNYFELFFNKFKFFMLIFFASLFSVLFVSKKSKYFFTTYILILGLLIISMLINDFSKLVLVVLFTYVISSYYLIKFLDLEIMRAYYNPAFSAEDLFEPVLLKLSVEIQVGEESYKGYLTNWDYLGFYVKLDEIVDVNKLKSPNLVINYDGVDFSSSVVLMSGVTSMNSYGFKVDLKSVDDDLAWFNFFEIIEKMGFKMELLK